MIVLEKKKEKYEIIEKIKVEYNYEVEFLKNNSILLLETFIHYRFPFDEVIDKTSITILDFSEKEIKKETFNIGYKIEINTFEKLKNKNLFKLNDNFFIIASDKEIYFFNLKYKEIISKYELEARLLDIIYYKDDFYLCCLGNNKVGLIYFKDEFIIKETKVVENCHEFIKGIDDLYILCYNDDYDDDF